MRCPVFKECGGCQFKHDDYPNEVLLKQNRLKKDFPMLSDFLTMENPFYYRHKVIASFELRNKKVISGLYRQKSRRVVSTQSCLIENLVARKIINTTTQLLDRFQYRIYNLDKHFGLFRHILVRVGYHTNEVMVVLVVSDQEVPGRKRLVNELLKKHPEITTIVFNVNKRKTPIVLGEKNITAYGPGFIYDKIGDFKFKLSPQSFFQVNPFMTERLYAEAIELANLNSMDRVLDTYCGIGTITMSLAQKVKSVVGVELNPQAIKDAVLSSKLNKIENVQFIQADSTEYMKNLVNHQFDVLFMDPPREGSTAEFLQSAIELNFKKIVYISCNPITQKRDVDLLQSHYQIKEFVGVDQFPFTDHVESICVLERK